MPDNSSSKLPGNYMAVEISLIRLREIALALPRPNCEWEERPQFAPPATPQSIVEIESLAGFVLPNEFRTYKRCDWYVNSQRLLDWRR